MGIEQHIDKYGPQNRYRYHFEKTDKTEQVRLFDSIVDAIHKSGEGLNNITYHSPAGKPIDKLLRHPEVVHLQDVANLIDYFYAVSGLVILITCLLIAGFRYYNITLPNLKQQAIGITIFTVACFVCILAIGPVTVFYALHEWVFPDGHQWFFYYQESLMTVLMKAPDLFAAISGIIMALGIVIYLVLNRIILMIPTYKKSA